MPAPRISLKWNEQSASATAPAVVLAFPARDRRAARPTDAADTDGTAGSPLAATPQLGERPTLVPPRMREWLKVALVVSLAIHAIVSIGMHLRFDDDLERAAGAAAALSSEGTVTIPIEVVMESVLPSAPSPIDASAADSAEASPDPQQADPAEDAPPVPQMTALEDLLPPPEPAPVVLPNREEAAQAALPEERSAPPDPAESEGVPQVPEQGAEAAIMDGVPPLPVARPAEPPMARAEVQKQKSTPSTPSRAASPSRSAGANSNASSGAGGAADAGGRAAISSYFARVQAHLSRHRVYPPEARASGVSGIAHVVFSLGRDGRVLSVSLARGSGHGVLDQAALAMVRRAAPFPPFPTEIATSRLEMGAPIRFDLR